MKMSVTDLLEKSSGAVDTEQNGDICGYIKCINDFSKARWCFSKNLNTLLFHNG